MRSRLLFIFMILLSATTFAQQPAKWDKWQWLVGNWKGEGEGKPGQGKGTFSFKPDLNEHVLVRKSHSEYPANGNRPATTHDDLMVVYADYTGTPSKAIYFDNEGHTINYSITYADKAIVMVSEKVQNVPTFRLTYTSLDSETVNTKFEMSQDGTTFVTYVEGKSKKVK